MSRILICLTFVVFLTGCVTPQEKIAPVMDGLNQAYKDKDPQAFMENISVDFQGNRQDLSLAVENDFAGFVSVDYSTSITQAIDVEDADRIKAKIFFLRTAKSARFGVDNQNGETTLDFILEDGKYKLWKMPYPPLYGLIMP